MPAAATVSTPSGGSASSASTVTTAATVVNTTANVTPTAVGIGLSLTKKCDTTASIAAVVSSMITERFDFSTAVATTLKTNLEGFFTIGGVTNDETFAFMSDSSSWPPVATSGRNGYSHKSITIPVLMLLSQLAGKVQQMLDAGYYLESGVKYADFHKYIQSLPVPQSSSGTNKSSSTTDDHKMPSFKVPIFKGDIMAGDEYMDDVVICFTNHALEKYLTDETYCTSNLEWSSAFASRIRESIKGNDILGFIATEEASERNCAKLWSTINNHLTSADLTMARAMALWNTLFGLKCEERDSFLHFYSKAKSVIFKLKQHKSVAIGDDIFLRAYFAKVIEAPELQTEVKKLVTDKAGTYESILELVHKDFRAQETSGNLRDVNSGSASSRRSRTEERNPSDNPTKKPKISEEEIVYAPFPTNHNSLLPQFIYTQVRNWYNHMIIPIAKRTAEDKAWFRNFQFDRRTNAEKKNGGFHPGHGVYDSGRQNGSRTEEQDRDRQTNSYYGAGSNSHKDYGPRGDNCGPSGRQGRRVDFHLEEEKSNNDDYEDFLAWKERSRSLRRARAPEDNGDSNHYRRPRRDQIFHF